MDTDKTTADTDHSEQAGVTDAGTATDGHKGKTPPDAPRETNGPKGPEPTRYGDWEQKGRCSDF